MDSEQKFWITVWSLTVSALVSLLSVVVITTAVDDRAIENLVVHGADPLAAACAVRGHQLECVAAGARK